MGTVRDETDRRIMRKSCKKSGRKERGHGGKSPKQGLTTAKDLTIELLDKLNNINVL